MSHAAMIKQEIIGGGVAALAEFVASYNIAKTIQD